MNVFLSVGRTATEQQESFVRNVEDFLRSNGFEPQTVGRTSFSSRQPLAHIRNLMESCSGAVVVAFERILVNEGVESRGGANPTQITETPITTVWNQIETALAYAYDRPALVIVERGIREEGVLAEGFDWFILRVDLTQTAFATAEFQGVFQDWKQRVISGQVNRSSRRQIDLDKISLSDLLANMRITQVYALLGAVIAALSAAATVGYWVARHLVGTIK